MEWPDYKHFSPMVIQDISADDTELMAEVVKEFIKCVPAYMGELDAAVGDQDFTKVKFVAHKLKGSSRFIGAEGLASLLQQIELSSDQAGEVHQVPGCLAHVHQIIPPLMEEVNEFYGVLTR
jgi:two-component system phosphorelay protein LuxU